MSSDFLQKFWFDDTPARGAVVQLERSWQDVLSCHAYPPAMQKLLGEILAAASLLTANIKFQGSLSLQLQGSGPVKLLFAECTPDGQMRGLGRWEDPLPDALAFADVARVSQMAVTLDPGEAGTRYQGIVPAAGNSLGQALEAYFEQSEQLPTVIFLAANRQRCAGFLLQRLPTPAGVSDDAAEEDWRRIRELGMTVTREEMLELDAQTLLYRLFHEETVRVFEPRALEFRCRCSRERVAGMLQSLGRDEAFAAAEETGLAEITCEFCNRQYRFDAVDLGVLFAAQPVPDATTPLQ